MVPPAAAEIISAGFVRLAVKPPLSVRSVRVHALCSPVGVTVSEKSWWGLLSSWAKSTDSSFRLKAGLIPAPGLLEPCS